MELIDIFILKLKINNIRKSKSGIKLKIDRNFSFL